MEIAHKISDLGTCLRLKVGCVLISKDGRVVGVGYNGAGPQMEHCHEEICGPAKRCLRCVHAECNALANRSQEPYTAYVTHSPCLNCLRELALAGVRKVVFSKKYTSMSPEETEAYQEWISHYNISMEQFDGTLE